MTTQLDYKHCSSDEKISWQLGVKEYYKIIRLKKLHTRDLLEKKQEGGCLCVHQKQQQTEEDTGLIQSFLVRGWNFSRWNFPGWRYIGFHVKRNGLFTLQEVVFSSQGRVFCGWNLAVKDPWCRGLATYVAVAQAVYIPPFFDIIGK